MRDAERRRAYDEMLGPAALKTALVRKALANSNLPSARHRGLLMGGLAIAAVIAVDAYANRQAPPAPIATANVGLVSDIIACPGLDYCNLANTR